MSLKLIPEEIPFFNFEVLAPIVTFDDQKLSSVLSSLYDYEIVPMHLITDLRNPVFDAIVDNRPLGGPPFKAVVIPIRYLKQFLA